MCAINLLTNSITSAGAPWVLQQRTDFLNLNLICHFKPGLPEKCHNFCQQHKNNLVPHSSKSFSEGANPRRRWNVGWVVGGLWSLYQSTDLGSSGSKLGRRKEKLCKINWGWRRRRMDMDMKKCRAGGWGGDGGAVEEELVTPMCSRGPVRDTKGLCTEDGGAWL